MNLVTCIWNSGSDQYTSRYICCSITYQHCYKHLGTQSTCFDLTSGWCLGEQARSLPTDNLRPAFLITNAVIYVIQVICLWKLYWLKILCTIPPHGSLEYSVKSTLYRGWQLAGLHLGVFVVVTKLSGPHCGKNFLCRYAVSSFFSNRTRCQIYCLRVTWSILRHSWLYSLQLWLIVQVLVHFEWWPGSWACMGFGGGSCVTSGSIWIFALWRKVWPLLSLMLDGTVIANIDDVPFSVLFSQSSFAPSW